MAKKVKSNAPKPERPSRDERRLQVYRIIFFTISILLVLSLVLSAFVTS